MLLYKNGFLISAIAFLLARSLVVEGQGVSVVCDKKFGVTVNSATLNAIYCGNAVLGSPADTSLSRALVVVHGGGREASESLQFVEEAASAAGNTNTVIIAPQFVTPDDAINELTDLYWSSLGWRQGNTSNGSPFRISSFEVVDLMIAQLLTDYPDLAEIVILGHSAGGQFVHRYAAGGNGENIASQSDSPASFSYIVTNPSSYLYFSGERPVTGTLDTFEIPDSSNCPEYNDYTYGLYNMNQYMNNVGASIIAFQYSARTVVVFLGDADTSTTGSIDTSCSGNIQGVNRYERGLAFYNHALNVFSTDNIGDRHSLLEVPGVGHDDQAMFNSACGLKVLYNYDPNGDACILAPRAMPSVVPSITPSVMPSKIPSSSPALSAGTAPCPADTTCASLLASDCCEGQRCMDNSHCRTGLVCSGGKKNTRVCEIDPNAPTEPQSAGPTEPPSSPSPTEPPSSSSPTEPQACAAKGEACGSDEDCCSNNCKQSICKGG